MSRMECSECGYVSSKPIHCAGCGRNSCMREIDEDRDRLAAENQSQLYLDGWRQCKREADAAVDSPASIIDSPADSQSKPLSFSNGIEEIGYVDAAGKCHGKVPRKYCGRWRAYNDAYRSLLDPTRRIDR